MRRALLLAGLALVLAGAEPPLLHPLLGDHAVLQRGRALPLWGWAAPGATVRVELAGAAAEATADAEGRWRIAWPALAAGGPHELAVVAAGQRTVVRDLLVGDVWLCSGQSNMAWTVDQALDPAGEKARADLPRLRLYTLPADKAGRPGRVPGGAWQVASADTIGAFSAVAYQFGRRLHQDLGVPIGLVNSSLGGTSVKAWMSTDALATTPGGALEAAGFLRQVEAVEAQRARTGEDYPQLIATWYRRHDPGSAATPGWQAADPADPAWRPLVVPGPLAVGAGTAWVARRLELPAAAAGRAAELAIGRPGGYDTVFVNGREVGASEESWRVRRYRIPAGLLAAGVNTLAIRLLLPADGARWEGGAREILLSPAGLAAIPLSGAWRLRAGTALAASAPLPLRFERSLPATACFNGMIAPLAPLALAGVVWYQGEADVADAGRYRTRLTALMGDWRARFAQPALPFLVVQLPNFLARAAQPGDSAWAALREAQAQAVADAPPAALITSIDIGEADNGHPRDKRELGRRLALAARALVGGEAVASSGPRFQAMTVAGAEVRLRFASTGDLALASGTALRGVALAGPDRVFHWAEARLAGDAVLATCPAVPAPVAARYAWADNPEAPLTDASGLPATPFRTDDWPITPSTLKAAP